VTTIHQRHRLTDGQLALAILRYLQRFKRCNSNYYSVHRDFITRCPVQIYVLLTYLLTIIQTAEADIITNHHETDNTEPTRGLLSQPLLSQLAIRDGK